MCVCVCVCVCVYVVVYVCVCESVYVYVYWISTRTCCPVSVFCEWVSKVDLQLLSQCGSMHACLWRSVSVMRFD